MWLQICLLRWSTSICSQRIDWIHRSLWRQWEKFWATTTSLWSMELDVDITSNRFQLNALMTAIQYCTNWNSAVRAHLRRKFNLSSLFLTVLLTILKLVYIDILIIISCNIIHSNNNLYWVPFIGPSLVCNEKNLDISWNVGSHLLSLI